MSHTIRLAAADEREAIATLIRDSTNAYYVDVLGKGPIFPPDQLTTTDMVDLYEQLEGSACLVCADGDELLGSCFYHVREQHISLGIMNVHPAHFGKGVARALLGEILARAAAQNKPVRLVSSCLNLDSYSLYTRAGFAPFEVYQDILFKVPDEGFAVDDSGSDLLISDATVDDLDEIVALERSVSGIGRASDHRHFLTNPDGHWHVSLARREGRITGVLASCGSGACNMIGPGVAEDEGSAFALIVAELNQHKGRTPVVLVPGRFNHLVQRLYALGGRNCELHVAQCTVPLPRPNGIILPTFLPESG